MNPENYSENSEQNNIKLKEISFSYNNIKALEDISISVSKGSVHAILGHNGSGKSTLLKIISGLLIEDSGKLEIFGRERNIKNCSEFCSYTGVVPEDLALFDNVSAIEHLQIAADLYDIPKNEREKRCEELLKFLDLRDARNLKPSQFSYGMKKKLAISMALIHKPQTLIMDEPFEGLDPVCTRQLKDLIKNLSSASVTVLIASHSLDILAQIISHFSILKQSRLVKSGSYEISDNMNIEDIYLKYNNVEAPLIWNY